jgi:dolichol-phosphate mannosyltransferase
MRFLTAIPVFNEARHIDEVLVPARRWSPEILVVDDGSTDDTPARLARQCDVHVLRHPSNEGYGAALRDAFRFAIEHNYDVLVTMDCDGQHQPERIGQLVAATTDADIASGSRYLQQFPSDSTPPPDRLRINHEITAELNRRFGLRLSDAFCGFKAYRAGALRKLEVTEPGYGMPLEVWVQVAYLGLSVQEVAVPLIYLEEERAFGGALDDARRRLAHYYEVIERAVRRVESRGRQAESRQSRDDSPNRDAAAAGTSVEVRGATRRAGGSS